MQLFTSKNRQLTVLLGVCTVSGCSVECDTTVGVVLNGRSLWPSRVYPG